MKEIREAVDYACGLIAHFEDDGDVLSASMIMRLKNLAEKVLAAKMPEKKGILEGEDVECFTANDMNRAYNQAIDDCRIAITGALLSVKELDRLIQENGYKTIEEMAIAIHLGEVDCNRHFAQMEKLGGVK